MKMKRIFALLTVAVLVTALASGCNREGSGASSGPEWEYYTEWQSYSKTTAANPGQTESNESNAENPNASGGSNEKNTTKKGSGKNSARHCSFYVRVMIWSGKRKSGLYAHRKIMVAFFFP